MEFIESWAKIQPQDVGVWKMEDSRLASIEKKLDEHGGTLKEISETLSKLAVQEERIKNLESAQSTLWRKYDQLIDPSTGQLSKIVSHQASCPRPQIKFLWWFVGTVNISVLIALVVLVMKWLPITYSGNHPTGTERLEFLQCLSSIGVATAWNNDG